ncbi:hypothetical protein H2198_004523 [Neophaeococcomyces mojaviensis]|uniref:Uncharacterized protein n=1 Tax=Neophaeococcomyces mojaviensis TaxID=3383035 RepID=A0ACC3A8D5_9EURO|nr:hypothetical protein H2198_004523 [Knufia sp. JES_112]
MKFLSFVLTAFTFGLGSQAANAALPGLPTNLPGIPTNILSIFNPPSLPTRSISLPALSTLPTPSLSAQASKCITQLEQCVISRTKAGLPENEIDKICRASFLQCLGVSTKLPTGVPTGLTTGGFGGLPGFPIPTGRSKKARAQA